MRLFGNKQEAEKAIGIDDPHPPRISEDDRILLAWQRTHMANERTFLSWSRTSISLLGVGFVVEKFELFLDHLLKLAGVQQTVTSSSSMLHFSLVCFLIAGLSILVSGARFLQVRRHIDRGEASFSIVPDILVIIFVTAVVILALVLSLPRLREMAFVIV